MTTTQRLLQGLRTFTYALVLIGFGFAGTAARAEDATELGFLKSLQRDLYSECQAGCDLFSVDALYPAGGTNKLTPVQQSGLAAAAALLMPKVKVLPTGFELVNTVTVTEVESISMQGEIVAYRIVFNQTASTFESCDLSANVNLNDEAPCLKGLINAAGFVSASMMSAIVDEQQPPTFAPQN